MAEARPHASGPILVVDDEPDARYLVSSVLQQEGFEVATAIDGADALRIVASRRPALVLLDWRLPGQSGAEVAGAIRAHHPDLRFVVVTADGLAEEKASRIHARGWLRKPFHLGELLTAVSDALATP